MAFCITVTLQVTWRPLPSVAVPVTMEVPALDGIMVPDASMLRTEASDTLQLKL